MIMATNPITVQKMFVHLMPVGTEMQVTVIPSMENEEAIRVRSTSGCFGILSPGNNFPQGTLISAKVVDFQEGIPVFEPIAEWKLTKTPQKARVLFTTPCGIAAELEEHPGCYVSYQKQQGLPEELKDLKENSRVIVCGLTPADNGTYNAQTLRPVPEEKAAAAEDPMAPWPESKIKEAVAQGSRKCCGKARLGKVVAVEVTTPLHGKMKNGETVKLRNGFFPGSAERAFVRIVFIFNTEDNRILGELVKVDDTVKAAAPAEKEDVTAVGYCNDEIRRAAVSARSLWQAGPYKLGYNYKVRIDGGVPFFEPSREVSKYPVGIVNVNIDDRCRQTFSDEDEVICRINHIHRDGDDVYTFRVSILKVV